MTTETSINGASDLTLSPELLARGDRIARQRARALRRLGRRNDARRLLPAAVVTSAALLVAGLADRFVQSATQPTAARVVSSAAPASAASTQTLAGLSQLLAQDRAAIAQLAQVQAALAHNAEGDNGTASATPSPQVPSLPALPALPSVSLPTVAVPAPATHASTGASVVVP